MAEHDNAGFPLTYCLLTTASAVEPGKRTSALEAWARELKTRYSVDPKFILLDKDMAEIAMSKRVWPTAKIQLCFWHLKRAITTRADSSKLSTTPYKPKVANALFPFIDISFKPRGRADRNEYEGGFDPDEEPPNAPVPERPWALKFRLPLTQSQSLSSAAEKENQPPATNTIRIPPMSQFRPSHNLESEDEEDEEMDTDEAANSGRRQFCASELKAKVIEMVERHYHAHPLIPGYAANNPQAIHEWAVREMYEFCVAEALPELWAYMWGNWYRPGRWDLWARSTCEGMIAVLKTTMILESQ